MEDRIQTTHVGSLPRPESLLSIMHDRAEGRPYDPAKLEEELAGSVSDVVRRQVEVGIDFVSDGEFSKPSYATYVTERLTGFGGTSKMLVPADLREFRGFSEHLVKIGGVVPKSIGSCCQGPVCVKDTAALEADLRMMRAAVDAAKPVGAFLNAASPGVVAIFQHNDYYPSDEAYIEAVAEAMRVEYEAIVEAGFLLQIDSPDLAMGRHFAFAGQPDEVFLKVIDRNVEALNHALRNIPAEKTRMHLCWGNYEGPHNHDIPLETIAARVFRAKPKYLLLEGANPRHNHEWAVLETIKLPEDKVVVPGVIDSTSNFIEHPDVVANRLMSYANVVGRDRVMAGSDCGFSTFSGFPTVHPDIVWRKLESMVEGARRASAKLWPAGG
ncbi:5-methyltetrahydropteroyltriglutamate--homocysteine methyltransferase [Sphingomonas sp. YR710]|uniref:cobalamin-independent methionine synthase II family protein n=1 Tax=Sphingomonas sp. YR710 TaxID=1882773 RepID=UPI0008872987|nr:cobalamin-independent methionine synthase II family protein [Sphingomonas sp. YR710]SDD62536.1 5-methyltetrahydropteroyltriglutamate--homocysteine methyltransferase [Sphingomonas sp. YR710]